MSKYAYITVLYGNNIYLTGALVLGYSLMKTNTDYDRVILVTPDVSPEYREYLRPVYTNIIEINYVAVNPEIFADATTRFRDVFTKLACFDLVQYEKIILLDLDMIVAKNIDHLFQLTAPAAVVKHHYVAYGKKIPAGMICRNGELVGSINAGLMLLEPSLEEWADIQQDISRNVQLKKFKYPEQDYLSLRYCGDWTSITFNYNFQFGLTKRVRKAKYRIDDIYVIHYSSSYKPWNVLNKNHVASDDEKQFKKQHQKYYDLWLNAYESIRAKYQQNGITLPY